MNYFDNKVKIYSIKVAILRTVREGEIGEVMLYELGKHIYIKYELF